MKRPYFAPLTELTADPGTELNFALVPYHPADQEPGTTRDQIRLIDAAPAASRGGSRPWGICTECGMGRADREDIPTLLGLHRQIIATYYDDTDLSQTRDWLATVAQTPKGVIGYMYTTWRSDYSRIEPFVELCRKAAGK